MSTDRSIVFEDGQLMGLSLLAESQMYRPEDAPADMVLWFGPHILLSAPDTAEGNLSLMEDLKVLSVTLDRARDAVHQRMVRQAVARNGSGE